MIIILKIIRSNDGFEYELELLEQDKRGLLFLIEYQIKDMRYVMSFYYNKDDKRITNRHIENIDALEEDEIYNAHIYFSMLQQEITKLCNIMIELQF